MLGAGAPWRMANAKIMSDTRIEMLGAKSKVSIMMKDTTLIEDGKLAMEVFLATIKDDSYGHLAEAIKQSVGEEHEQKLRDILTRLQIPFCDEHVLR